MEQGGNDLQIILQAVNTANSLIGERFNIVLDRTERIGREHAWVECYTLTYLASFVQIEAQ